MKFGRLIWAVLMTGAALGAAAGYTAAGTASGMQVAARESFPELQAPTALPAALISSEVQPEPQVMQQTQDEAHKLFVTVRAGDLPEGTILRVSDADGEAVGKAAVNAQGEGLLELVPGKQYTVWADNGPQAAFYLEDNASLSGVEGDGWTDGELLYLTEDPRCTLTVQMTVADGETEAVYLEGDGVSERRDLNADNGGKAVFAGLEPGDYTLTAGETSRKVTMTKEMASVFLGLD